MIYLPKNKEIIFERAGLIQIYLDKL
ncbi:MAG: hypothetical protein V4471_06445 [Pseudomonadota bacterium]